MLRPLISPILMKNSYWLFFLLFAFTARAQNFSPFHPGALMQYTAAAGDSVRLLRLERRGATGFPGQDSLYRFAERAIVARGTSPTAVFFGCWPRRGGSGPFGETLLVSRSGTMQAEYTLLGSYNAAQYSYDFELLLKPRAPLNQAWMTNSWGVTARVTSRTVAPVLGVPDSVVTIAFSGGQQLTLSKAHGLVESPVLAYFSAAGAPRRQVLTALPSARLGQVKLGALAVYDFQPGDRFVYSYESYVNNSPPSPVPVRTTYLFADSILSRTTSRTGDTLTYRVLTCSQRGSGTSTVATVRYTLASGPGTRSSQQYLRRISPFGSGNFSGTMLYDAAQGPYPTNRAVQRVFYNTVCTDTSKYAGPNIDLYAGASYATGLGCVNDFVYDHFGGPTSTTLVGYRKVTETWGQLPRLLCSPLATAAGRTAATTAAFPNPFGAELAVTFTLAYSQGVAFTLRDGLGRVVLARLAAPLPAGAQQVALPVAGLPAGIYSLHLRFGGEGRTEVLRVLKAK